MVVVLSLSSLSFLISRLVELDLDLVRGGSAGKYEMSPLNFSTSARALIKPQELSSSAYCSLQARYSHSLLMSSNGLLTHASSSN